MKLVWALIPLSICATASAEQVGPWDLSALKSEVPAMRWIRRDQSVHSLLYAGEEYRGRSTEVFAFYASPATLGEASEGERFPAVVLIHGGGGTAFADWAYLWAKRGYAAIAMDLAGSQPPDPVFNEQTGAPESHHRHDRKQRKRLPNGGPDQSHAEKFDSIGGSADDDWPYHAVATVLRGHTLIRSFPDIDPLRTAVTGISWGGYTTCLVASLDDRFRAAVPVYGCGFLHEGESVQKPSIDRLGERKSDWVKVYDPGSQLIRCRVPILFVNGTNDKHYPLDSYMKSYEAVPGPKQLRVTVRMPHSHPSGWAPKEIGLFIDSHCRDGVPLPVPGRPVRDGDQVTVRCPSETPITQAEAALHERRRTACRTAVDQRSGCRLRRYGHGSGPAQRHQHLVPHHHRRAATLWSARPSRSSPEAVLNEAEFASILVMPEPDNHCDVKHPAADHKSRRRP